MKKRFTDEQIVAALSRHQNGEKAKDLCREFNVSGPTFYAWKAKFNGMSVPDVKRMKDLELENSGLKKLVANLTLDIDVLKDINSRKW